MNDILVRGHLHSQHSEVYEDECDFYRASLISSRASSSFGRAMIATSDSNALDALSLLQKHHRDQSDLHWRMHMAMSGATTPPIHHHTSRQQQQQQQQPLNHKKSSKSGRHAVKKMSNMNDEPRNKRNNFNNSKQRKLRNNMSDFSDNDISSESMIINTAQNNNRLHAKHHVQHMDQSYLNTATTSTNTNNKNNNFVNNALSPQKSREARRAARKRVAKNLKIDSSMMGVDRGDEIDYVHVMNSNDDNQSTLYSMSNVNSGGSNGDGDGDDDYDGGINSSGAAAEGFGNNSTGMNMYSQFQDLFISPWQKYWTNFLQHETDSAQVKQAYFQTIKHVQRNLAVLVQMAQSNPRHTPLPSHYHHHHHLQQQQQQQQQSYYGQSPLIMTTPPSAVSQSSNSTMNISPVLSPVTPGSSLLMSHSNLFKPSSTMTTMSSPGNASIAGEMDRSKIRQQEEMAHRLNMLYSNLNTVQVTRLEKRVQELENQLKHERSINRSQQADCK